MISTQVLLADDQGRCWSGGDPGDGRLGRGGSSEIDLIEGLEHVSGVAAGACHSLAFTSKGTLYAWGLASDGRLGFTTEGASAPPTRVALDGVLDASAGKFHSLVIASEGVVFSFGDNSYGQLGLGSTEDAWAPACVALASSALCVAAGASHSLVLLEDGDAMGCVEINRCVGCTRQFFTNSFLGDDAAVLARSSGEELASPRHRAGVASMAWRTMR